MRPLRLFGNKDGLLNTVAEYGFAAYLARKPAPRPAAGPIQDLRAGWDLHIGFGLANPALFALIRDAENERRGVGRVQRTDRLLGRDRPSWREHAVICICRPRYELGICRGTW